MTQYIEKLFPFIENSDFIKTSDETVNVDDIYCPVSFNLNIPNNAQSLSSGLVQKKRFQAIRVQPSNVLMVNETDSILNNIMSGAYGITVNLNVTEYDYSEVASRIEVTDNIAYMKINEGYLKQDVASEDFINTAANGVTLDKDFYQNITIPKTTQTINLIDWLNGFAEEEIMESADMFDSLLANVANGKETSIGLEENKDYVYKWLDSYFALPEGVSATQGGREVVPLLIGPTGVFKSATIKELCKKYDYRLVDFRVAFTSRLDYSGLFQMSEVEDKKYSYACPMEEIVTCSDGFREYCRRAYDKVSQILAQGYIVANKASDGEVAEGNKTPISDEQRKGLEKLLSQYKEYTKTPVLFFDEITRCFSADTRVRLVDGRIRTMKELYEEYGEDKPFYVYACTSDGHVRFVPAYSRGVTRKNAQMVKVTLDNGAEVICTPDHRWMLRDGSYEQAQFFEEGRSLMGTYFGTQKFNNGKFSSEYETYIEPANLTRKMTHQEVARQYDTLGIYGTQDENGNYYQAHHINLNSRDNTPDNIVVVSRKDHRCIHSLNAVNTYLMKTNPEYVEFAKLGFKRAIEKCPDFYERQKEALIPVRESFEYRKLRSEVNKKALGDEAHRSAQRDRCLTQWERGDFNFDRVASNRKMHIEKCVRFVKMLQDSGYNVTSSNYDNFVKRFANNHGPYYSVMSSVAIERNGLTLNDILSEVNTRDWDSYLLNIREEYNTRKNKIVYSDNIQREVDNPSIKELLSASYPEVDLRKTHVQNTLSFLNTLGNISSDEYEVAFSNRDVHKWQNVYRLDKLQQNFGSFEIAKEMSKVYNHKVVKVELLNETMDAYDIEVPGLSNFLIDLGDNSGVFVHNCKDAGVEGLLTEMLNQKRFNNMQLQGCKFVAATNLNLKSRTDTRHNNMMDDLDEMYDVNTDLDVAYSNRFLPLRVQPEDVQDRWFGWAKQEKATPTGNIQNIHPVIVEFLTNVRPDLIYNDTPVLDALEKGLTDNETKSQVYPNYRTWDMLSGYMYKIDRDWELNNKDKSDSNTQEPKLYKTTIINGLISTWGASAFIPFLDSKGYQNAENYNGGVDDEYSDFLETSLDSNVPALMVGPSSMGKTSRLKSYVKRQKEKTGLEPVLINIDLSSKDVVDLMGMPTKVNLVDYVAGSDLGSLGLGDVGKELSSIVDGVCKEQKYGLSSILTVRAPDMDIKDRLLKAKQEGRDVIFFLDELNRVKNTSVLSAAFEIISDSRFAGVSFKDMKDKVKVVAACNMAHSEMGDEGDYGSAGSIDPALAARFSIFWKKHYDEKDVKSWISYMEQEKAEGKIDGVVLEYFKTLEPEKAVEIIAKVEKRQLAYAEPSTRNLHQLSMDIKSMRGKSGSPDSKLFYGKLLFDTMTRDEFGNLYDNISSSTHNEVDIANSVKKLGSELLENKDVWDAAIAGKKVTINGTELGADDVMDNLAKCIDEINKLIIIPLDTPNKQRLNTLNKLAADLMRACSDLDDVISQEREAIFETYVGEGFAREFTPFFNENFGSENDVEITLEMLSDKSLIKPFFRKYRSSRTGYTEEKYEDSIIDLMGEFMQVHGNSLSPDVYAAFIDGANASLASTDGIERILRSASGNADALFAKAEEVGDSWILSLLSYTRITQADIDSIRARMSSGVQRKRKSVVL